MSHRLVIFGANGDLASRKLMPALARLHQVGKLPSGFSVLGITRNPWGTQRLRETLERYAGDVSLQSRNALLSSEEYRRSEATDAGTHYQSSAAPTRRTKDCFHITSNSAPAANFVQN
jgi:glucose-6-phosphate 1-dehydrogenase